jgi:hypothetical protein
MSHCPLIAVPERVSKVMRILVAAADAGEPCPSNLTIASAVGSSSMATGASCIALLESMNLISVERGNCSRVVTIVATGKRTAGKVAKGHWRDLRSRWNDDLDADLMDAIADGASWREAAERVGDGCTVSQAKSRFDTLRARMGAQAQ